MSEQPTPEEQTLPPPPQTEEEEKQVESSNPSKKSKKKKKKQKKEATEEESNETAPPQPTGKSKKSKKPKKEVVVPVDQTPAGQKKDLSGEMPPEYFPSYVESAWQEWWEASGYYGCDETTVAEDADPFVMVIPPPNVTGSLHLGHALTIAIEDTLTRYNRMKGRPTLWIPGTDHAGIATQSVVERMLMKETGQTRHDLGREAFTEKVWEWKETYGSRITNQIRQMGSSVDWSREVFTMDATRSKAVTEAFVRMFDDGLIYRDTRMVNWSCALKSAISDIEVDHEEIPGRTLVTVPNHEGRVEVGVLIEFAYPIEGGEEGEELVVATTRLETMLGDSAVAVHPEDPRYQKYHGRRVVHPFRDDDHPLKTIPIICDAELVDMEFGTGCVKITPAHDPNDYMCGKRHNLEFMNILTEEGLIKPEVSSLFGGKGRYVVRREMEQVMKDRNLFRDKRDNAMSIARCSRSGDIIEPMTSPQWFVQCKGMADRAVDAVATGALRIIPEFHVGTWNRWLGDIRDWCISRQLWWGHRIPAYICMTQQEHDAMLAETGELNLKDEDKWGRRWVVGRSEEDARVKAQALLAQEESKDGNNNEGGPALSSILLFQDEDVLDTWFSSGLFPFSSFNWPDDNLALQKFFPTSLLETGHDILFFWVARMVMMSLQLTDQLPFNTVYLHAMVRDKSGRKMSKSLGNVIDPLEVIRGASLEDLIQKLTLGNLPEKEVKKAEKLQRKEFPEGIPSCGADSLRFGLLAYTIQGRNINLDVQRVVGYRQFCNKMWNATRFAYQYLDGFSIAHARAIAQDLHADGVSAISTMSNAEVVDFLVHSLHGSQETTTTTGDSLSLNDMHLWILSRFNHCVQACNESLEGFAFADVCSALNTYFINELCDVYLEAIKHYQREEGHEQALFVSRLVLFHMLRNYFMLLHPTMPFVSEELFQRLDILLAKGQEGEEERDEAKRGEEAASSSNSIMLQRYPSEVASWARPELEHTVEGFLLGVVHAIRSMRSDYNILKPENSVVRVKSVASSLPFLSENAPFIQHLSRSGSVEILDKDSADGADEDGWVKRVMGEDLEVLLLLRGQIDVEKEIARIQKQMEKNEAQVAPLRRLMEREGYEDKVPEDVRLAQSEKVSQAEAENAILAENLAKMELMRG
jgi:valyl-tRNA synthetase